MSEPDAAIRIRSLTKRYGDVEAIRGIELDVWASEIFGLIGPDGAGKTSTFQILGGVMEATSGAAELLGQSARQARAYVGYLTQAFSLYQDLSVAENLRYVGELRGVPVREIEQRGQHYLTMFGMERFTDRLAGRPSCVRASGCSASRCTRPTGAGRRRRWRSATGSSTSSASATVSTCWYVTSRPASARCAKRWQARGSPWGVCAGRRPPLRTPSSRCCAGCRARRAFLHSRAAATTGHPRTRWPLAPAACEKCSAGSRPS